MEELHVATDQAEFVLRCLRGAELFASLTAEELRKLMPFMRARSYDAGETVFSEGAAGDALYLVFSGGVEVRKKGLLFSKPVARLDPGQFFGEMALLFDDPRGATVLCVEPTTLFMLPAPDFRAFLGSHLDIAAKVQAAAVSRRAPS